jgi:hypothetical protein
LLQSLHLACVVAEALELPELESLNAAISELPKASPQAEETPNAQAEQLVSRATEAMLKVDRDPGGAGREFAALRELFAHVQAECDPYVAANTEFVIGSLGILIALENSAFDGDPAFMFEDLRKRIVARVGETNELASSCKQRLDVMYAAALGELRKTPP